MQRYQAIKELAKWNHKYEDLLEAEYRRDYSDADDLAKHRIRASQASFDDKKALWDSYLVPDSWRQTNFVQSVSNFYNSHER